ncbi:hypothetical protein AAMO2058_001268900 [Amorphochlora amoebiformis]
MPLLEGRNNIDRSSADPPRATFRPAYHLGVGFFLIFAALMPTQNLLTSINGKLGYYSIAAIYFFMSLSGPVAPFALAYFGGIKKSLLVAALCYVIFQIANVVVGIKQIPDTVHYMVLLPPSALLGMGACLLWTAEGSYATRVSQSVDAYVRLRDSEDEDVSHQNTLGFVNGLILVFIQFANLVMNLASSAILVSGASSVTLFLVLAAASAAGFAVLIFLPRVEGSERGESFEHRSFSECISEIVQLHKDRKLQVLLALFLVTGFTQGYLYSTLTGDLISPSLGKNWVGYAMAVSAAVDAIGSYLCGYLSDKFGRHPVLMVGFISNVLACILVVILGVKSNAYGYIFCVSILLGIADAVWMPLTSAIIAEEFPDRLTSVFASFTMWRSFATALISLLGPFLPLKVRTIIVGGSAIMAVFVPTLKRCL